MVSKVTTLQRPRLLLAVFSYDRFIGLRNLLSSIEQYMGNADVYVFDDHSSDPRISQLLQKKEAGGDLRWETTRGHDPAGKRLGRLYENLNRALHVGIEEEYDLLLLLQDDHQILWSDPNLLGQVHEFFLRHEDALMLDPRFIRRIQYHSSYGGKDKDPAISMRRGALAVGFIPPWRAKQIGFRFGHSERESSDVALALGKRCYKSRLPFVGDIPVIASFHLSPPFIRGRLWLDADEDKFAKEPILEPLTGEDIAIVKSIPNHCAVFAEDVVRRTDGHAALYPHAYNVNDFVRYGTLTLSAWWNEFRRVNRIRHLQPALSLMPFSRSRWKLFSFRMMRTNRLWRYTIYLLVAAKTAFFFLFLYPFIRLWMRREAQSFVNQLRDQRGH